MNKTIITSALWAGRDKPNLNLSDWGSRHCPSDCHSTASHFLNEVDGRFYEKAKAKASWPFHPHLNADHRCWAQSITEFPAIGWVGFVPQEHRLDEIALRIEPGIDVKVPKTFCNKQMISEASACAPAPDECCKVHPAGVTFNIVTQMHNNCTMEPEGDVERIDRMEELNLDNYGFIFGQPAEDTVEVPPCMTLLIGIEFLSGPNEESRCPDKNALGGIRSRITPITHVTNYDQILHQG